MIASPLFEPIDRELARALGRRFGESSPEVLLAAALASLAVRHGHVALNVDQAQALVDAAYLDRDLESQGLARPIVPSLAAIAKSRLVRGDDSPLVLEGSRLYLRRYWEHECTLATRLRALRAKAKATLDEKWFGRECTALFGESSVHREAARAVLERDFVVVTGGPGTGKTRTAVRLVALLLSQAQRAKRTLEVRMVAPTGKAAARLKESVADAKKKLAGYDQAVIDAIPEEASTIHKALGVVPGSVTRARHDATRPMRADVVVVDEASMIDASLFRRLVDAVRPGAKLVLLGDSAQLASVDAGAVFGDLVRAGQGSGVVCTLVENFRTSPTSPLGRLGAAVRAAEVESAIELLRGGHAGIEWFETDARDVNGSFRAPFESCVQSGYAQYRGASSAESALGALQSFSVLAAHRTGPWGVRTLDAVVEAKLAVRPRRIVMVTHNDYDVQLYNGDLGVVDKVGGELTAMFPGDKRLGVSRLPPHESAYAMTIHKTQGSEFDHVAIVLPDASSPLLGRELLYTAITRARSKLTLFGSEDAIRTAIARPTERVSAVGARVFSRSGQGA